MDERPIRLLQLVHGYPPAVGGVEIATRDRSERLVADHGFHVTILTTDRYTVVGFRDRKQPTIPRQQHEMQNGVHVYRFPVRTAYAPALRVASSVAYRVRAPGNDVLRTLYSGTDMSRNVAGRSQRSTRRHLRGVVSAQSHDVSISTS